MNLVVVVIGGLLHTANEAPRPWSVLGGSALIVFFISAYAVAIAMH
jgi:hypothetical protein